MPIETAVRPVRRRTGAAVIRHLLVPGLFGPLPRAGDEARVPRLPNLERVLARMDRGDGPAAFEAAACSLFGITGDAPPTAALRLAHETGAPSAGCWVHADPVHLRPDQDRLLLFDGRALGIGESEAAQCVAAFNAHFADDALELLAPTPSRWYLRVTGSPDVRFTALHAATGRDIHAYLPRGADARFWRGLLNEVQMLFHGLAVNAAREAAGRPAISGIWCSGLGELPSPGSTSIRTIRGDDPLVAALAAHAEVVGDDELWVETALQQALLEVDPAAWVAACVALDRQFGSAVRGELHLYPCDGSRYVWRPAMRRRWWRRIVPFARRLHGAGKDTAVGLPQTP